MSADPNCLLLVPLRLFPLALALALSLPLRSLAEEHAPEATLFSNGLARCYLDLSDQQSRDLQTEAPVHDLRTYFERMTGVPLPRTGGAGLIPLRLERTEYPASVSRFDARTVQGFEMTVSEEEVRLRAWTKVGLANAIYYLLDHWGCRWVMPGELGECIPRRDKLTLPAGHLSFAPRNDMAVEVPGSGRAEEWSRRNMAGWEYWINAQHYWFYAIPPKANLNPLHHWYYDANGVRITDPEVKTQSNFEEHPTWFSLLGGVRKPRQLCTSNPEVIARMTKVARDYLRSDRNPPTFPMDPNDVTDFCQCDACVALDVSGARTRGAPSVTDRVLTFVNAVAEGIKDEFPDRHVAFCAYATHIDPPKRVKPADNVIVLLCRSSHCLLHLTPTPKCPLSDFHSLVRRWLELTPNVYTYEYEPIHWTGELPCPTYLDMGRSLQHQLRDLGVKGSFSDCTMAGAKTSASWYVNHYLARRMKVDPTRSPDEVLHDMCTAFFGPAAGPMEGYYRELARVTDSAHPGRSRVGGGTTFYHELFTPEIVRAARGHLDNGLHLVVGKQPYQARVEMVDMSQRYLEAWLEGVWSAQKRRHEAAVAAFDRMDKMIDELEAHDYIAASDARFRARSLRMKPLARYCHEELGYVTNWKLLGPFDNSDRNGHRRRDSFEPVASVDDPVKLADGTQARWWNYESPTGGFLNLERAFAKRRGLWRLSYGYAGLNYNAPHAMEGKLLMDSFFLFKVYVNGEEVFSKDGLNFDFPDRYAIKVNLRAGNNVIVVKASQTVHAPDTNPWGLYLRVDSG